MTIVRILYMNQIQIFLHFLNQVLISNDLYLMFQLDFIVNVYYVFHTLQSLAQYRKAVLYYLYSRGRGKEVESLGCIYSIL